MPSAPPPGTGPADPGAEDAPQYEVLPLRGIVEKTAAQLPRGGRVTVTASPAQGLPATLEVAGALSGRGFHAIPHLAARMLRDAHEAEETLARLAEAGIAEVFVIAGDAPRPAGRFEGALDLLEVIAEAAPGMTAGVGTHPEGHPFLDETEAIRRLRAAAEHASYAVTQMCFSAAPLLAWARRLRDAGIAFPLRPGIAAPASTARLLRIGARIGVGRSLRMLGDESSGMRRLLGPGRWDPGPLLSELEAAAAEDATLALRGPHLYTFNDLEAARGVLAQR